MSKQQHTRGPWFVGEPVRQVMTPGVGYPIYFNEDLEQVTDYVYQEADARLIAAAPELLEAAEHCRELLMRYEINRVNGEEIADEAIAKLNAAIARARGES